MGAHLIDGEFQSDKYPTTPRGKVPLSVSDKTAQDLLWIYAQRRRVMDAEFADDLETALKQAGFVPTPCGRGRAARPMTPLEGMVRAACNDYSSKMGWRRNCSYGEPGSLCDRMCESYGIPRQIRVALEALREPSDALLRETAKAISECDENGAWDSISAADCYVAASAAWTAALNHLRGEQ